MNLIDGYLDDLASRLHLSSRARKRILAEVREHLTDAASVGDEANAVGAFGPAAALARQFNADAGATNTRRAPFVAAISAVVVAVAIVAAARHQSLAGVRPWVATEVSFFLGVVGVQISFVAWVCAGSRMSAIWRTSAMRGPERGLVRRCSLISTGAMTCASLAFSVAFILVAAKAAPGTDSLALVVCAIVMPVASIVGFELIRRAPANSSDEISSVEVGSGEVARGSILETGERALGVVRAHPVIAVVSTVIVAGWSAAAHAETSAAHSLPWVVAEVAAVVVAFIVLGPVLALRAPQMRDSTR